MSVNFYHLAALKKQLDQLVFWMIPERTDKILLHESKLSPSFVNPSDFNSIFLIKDEPLWLRYDHTKNLMNNPPSCGVKQYGAVFRNGPTSTGRYRQFYQYDIDVPYQQGKFYLKKLLQYFRKKGLSYQIKYNDLSLLRSKNLLSHHGELDQGIYHLEPSVIEKLKTEHKKLHPDISITNVDPQLVRGHNYYQSLVFQCTKQNSKLAICSGGSYWCGQKLFFGFSIGLERLLLEIKPNYVNTIVVIYDKVIPASLLEALEELKCNYLLWQKNSTLWKEWPKIKKSLLELNYNCQGLIITSAQEIASGLYHFKDKQGNEFEADAITIAKLLHERFRNPQ